MFQILEGPDSNVSNSDVNDYSWSELQRAMGATDEEMAILQNFGTNPAQENQEVVNSENNTNFIDLDCLQEACTNNVNIKSHSEFTLLKNCFLFYFYCVFIGR